jgi:hypothetical protein
MRTWHLSEGMCAKCNKKLPKEKMEFDIIQRVYETRYIDGNNEYRDKQGIPFKVHERLSFAFCSKNCLFKAVKRAYYSEIAEKSNTTKRRNRIEKYKSKVKQCQS